MKIASLIFIVLSLWSFGLIMILTNPKSRSNWWLGIMTLAPGLGVFGVILRFVVFPGFPNLDLHNISTISTNCLYMLSLYITPYAIFMFGLTYAKVFETKTSHYKLAAFSLFLPIMIMMLRYPIVGEYQPSIVFLGIWAIPYIVIANVLVIYAYFKEKIKRIRRQKLLTCFIFVPATLLIEMFNIFNLAYRDIWAYNAIGIISLFGLFLLLSIRYGVLGVRLKLEKEQLTGTIRSVTSGTLILNHALKNEIGKIGICMENIKFAAEKPNLNKAEITENSRVVNESLQYLFQMVQRIQNQVEDIVITKEPIRLNTVINKALENLGLLLREKNIKVIQEISPQMEIIADGFHIQEVLINLIKNAIEAMSSDGILYLGVIVEKRMTTVVVRDNGSGISPENLTHVLEPFFTTKSRQKNFGLGLTYCFNVLQKHGGSLEIESTVNSGTTVLLSFPRKNLHPLNKLLGRPINV